MQIKYSKIADISLKHNYYHDNNLRDYIIDPTRESLSQMHKNGLRLVPENDGYSLYRKGSPQDQQELLWQNHPLHLYFNLQTTDTNFLSFTQLPIPNNRQKPEIEIEGQMLYFFSNNAAVQQAGVVLLTQENVVGPKDRRMAIEKKFKMSLRAPAGTTRNLSISDDKGKVIHTQTLKVPEESSYPLSIDTIDLTDIAHTGRSYLLNIDGQVREELLIVDGVHQHQTFGLIQLTIGRFQGQDLLLTPAGQAEVKSVVYRIGFASRKVRWRYNVVFPPNKNFTYELFSIQPGQLDMSWSEILKNISVLSRTSIKFKEEKKRAIAVGQEAVPLLLDLPVELSEKTDQVFVLEVKEGGSEPQNIVLPKAAKSGIKPIVNDTGTEEYLSDIYVYY